MSIARLRFQTSHLRFSLAFCALLFAVCNAINFDKLSKWFRQGDGTDYLALAAYLVAGLCLFAFFFTLLAHRRTIKPAADERDHNSGRYRRRELLCVGSCG